MSDEHRRALEREVAGLPVDADALADAVTQRAFDRTVVVEALVRGLDDGDPAARREIARRAARLVDLDPRVQARLAVLTDQDPDARVREAAADALRAHGAPVPGEPEPEPRASAPRRLAFLGLRVAVARGAPGVTVVPDQEPGPDCEGVLTPDGAGGAVLTLHGLPVAFTGHRPVLRAAREPNGPRFAVVRADAPVPGSGHAVFSIPADVVPHDELVARLAHGLDLEVLAED